MRVVHLAAGAGGMICGSCLHDHRLAAALRAAGRDVVLLPLYTPLRTEEPDAAGPVYYGGINVFLQQASAVFRHTPRALDRLLDAPALLRLAGRLGGAPRAETLGALTVSVLQGPDGRQRKELDRLAAALAALRPDVVCLPNLMFVGLARTLKAATGAAVLCELTGEDIFVDALPEPHRGRALALIRARAADVDGFAALTDYYARHAAAHFGLPAGRIHRLPLAIRTEDFARPAAPPAEPFTIGYLARVCAAKGIGNLAAAVARLAQAGQACRLRVAGYVAPADRAELAAALAAVRAAGLPPERCEYVGELSRAAKSAFLRGLHVLSVPARYPESKGFYVLEALAAGVPVVQPEHGSFPELIAATGGGLLHPAGDTWALAEALTRLMEDDALRQRLGAAGRAAVHARFTMSRLAEAAWRLYESFAR